MRRPFNCFEIPTVKAKWVKSYGTFLLQGRNGRGSIYVFGGGNGGSEDDSCAYNGYVNSIYTIAINSVTINGTVPGYAERCSAILASTYSRDFTKPLSNDGIVSLFMLVCSIPSEIPNRSYLQTSTPRQ